MGSATNSKETLVGRSDGTSTDMTEKLASDATPSDDEEVHPESWWYYHVMMAMCALHGHAPHRLVQPVGLQPGGRQRGGQHGELLGQDRLAVGLPPPLRLDAARALPHAQLARLWHRL